MSRSYGPCNPYQHNADSGEFNALSKSYKAKPSIALYVELRRKHPKALIEISTSFAMDWLLSNGDALRGYGIDPQIVASCLDAKAEAIQELSLLLLENIILRERLESDGVTHVQTRDEIISDSLVSYLISMMLDALDRNNELTIPRDLIVLIKHQYGADVSAEHKKQDVRERRSAALWAAAEQRLKGEKCSIRDIANWMSISPSTVARWFPDGTFESEVEEILKLLRSDRFCKK